MVRLDQKRLNENILDMEVQGSTQFVKQIKEDLEIMGIKDDDCFNRVSFRKKIYDKKTLEN